MADEKLLGEIRAVTGKGQAKSDFIANRALVEAAIAAGHPKKVIWRVLHQKDEFRASYRQFLKYMGDLLPPVQATPVATSRPHAAVGEKPVFRVNPLNENALKAAAPAQPQRGFKFDPFKPDIMKTVAPKGGTPASEDKNGR